MQVFWGNCLFWLWRIKLSCWKPRFLESHQNRFGVQDHLIMIKCYILSITQACCKSKKRMTDWFYSQINIDCLIKWAVFFQNIFIFWQIETMSTKQYMRWVRVNLIFRKRFYWSFGTKPQNDIIEGYGAAEFQKVFLKGARCSRNTPESSGLVFSLHSRHIRKRP